MEDAKSVRQQMERQGYFTAEVVKNALKRVSLGIAVAGIGVAGGLQAAPSFAAVGDPVPVIEEQVAAKENLASLYRNMTVSAGDEADKPSTRVHGADYTNLIIGPGDPRDEGDLQVDSASGAPRLFALLPSASIPNVSAGDDADKPSKPRVEHDYRHLEIGPGDPDEENGPPQPDPDSGGVKENPAPSPRTLPDVSAGDEADKPSTRVHGADYTNLIIGPGDPCEEDGCAGDDQLVPGPGPKLFAPVPVIPRQPVICTGESDNSQSCVNGIDYSKVVVGPGDPCDITGCPVEPVFVGGGGHPLPSPLPPAPEVPGDNPYRNLIIGPGDPRDEG